MNLRIIGWFLPLILSLTISLSGSDIMKNVSEFSIDGVPGDLIVFGENAEPLLTDSDGKTVIAMTNYGKGRMIAFSHGGMIEEKHNLIPDNLKIFMNAAELLGVSGSKEKKVLIVPNFSAGHLKNTKWKIDRLPVLPENLSAYDLVIVGIPFQINSWFKKQEADRLLKYAEGGGKIMGAGIGWVYMSYGDGKTGESIKKFPANLLFAPAGIFFGTDYAKAKIPKSENAAKDSDSKNIIHAAVQIVKKGKSLSEKDLNHYLSAISRVKDATVELLTKEHKAFLIEQLKDNAKLIPTADSPLKRSKTEEILTIALLNYWISAGNDFPVDVFKNQKYMQKLLNELGIGSTDYSQTKRKIALNLQQDFWIETGIYARPLEKIKITADGGSAKLGLKVRVGAQSDILYPFILEIKDWKRWPEVSVVKSLNSSEIQIMNPFGGLIFIENPKPGSGASITVEGGSEAISFNAEKHSISDWNRMLKNSNAQWGSIGSSNIKIITTEKALKKVKDPLKLAKFWDTAWKNSQELVGEKKRSYVQYIVCDTQISLGYMHNGNPIMTWMDQEEFVVGIDGKLFSEGSWGHFHEIGHNMQRREWTFEGTGEVTTNIFTLYNMEKMFGTKPAANPNMKDALKKYKDYLKKGGDFEEWKNDPFLALMTYLKLIEKFGWDTYKSVFRQYESLPADQKPKTEQDKIDTWVRIFSKTAKMNLFPYFRKWAIPVSEKVNNELKSLPEWKFTD